jgi:hypothetical protein
MGQQMGWAAYFVFLHGLTQRLRGLVSMYSTVVSKEYVGHLLGLFELNNARMTVQSPLGAYAHAAKHALGMLWVYPD